ncbi:unnamed protein product [Orchesella dallaii]|uniref:Uncharacterized protein n=1 Tax=Orchesella dallaii TaxID=48710 RepID=A0ABP1RUF9_9HEXA
MNHLDISSSDFSWRDHFRKIIFELTPNLQYLALRKNQLSGPDFLTGPTFDPQKQGLKVNQHLTQLIVNGWTLEFPVTMTELLWHFPNIKILESLETDPRRATWFLCGLLKKVEYLRNTVDSHYLKNLAELRLFNVEKKRRIYLSTHLALALQPLQFPLKVLALDVGSELDDGVAKEMLQIILDTHANTLEELTLARQDGSVQFPDFPFGIQFPKLDKFRSTGKLVQNLEFLKDMPNLKLLFLEQEGQEIRLSKVGSSNSFVNPNLKEFKITDKFCTDEELNFLGEIMPNLTNITLGLSNKECFKSVCRIWKDVTILNINTRDIDEDAYWKTEDANEYITTNIRNLKGKASKIFNLFMHFYDEINNDLYNLYLELKSLNLGKFIEYLI